VLSNADLEEIRLVAGLRWPTDPVAGAAETWSGWRKSLDQFSFSDVMAAVILLGETSERFPSLARLRLGIEFAVEERVREEPKPLLEPPAPTTVEMRLAAFDQSMIDDRIRRHAELSVFVRKYGEGSVHGMSVAERHKLIEDVGPIEARAREELAKGGDPGELARRFVHAFSSVPGQPSGGANERSVVDLT
jgi:hypothetical protein